MDRKTALPAAQTFLICREHFEDKGTGEHVLIGPGHEFLSPHFPAALEINVFVQVSSCHGTYRPELRLQNLDGQVLWSQTFDRPFTGSDPLKTVTLTFHPRLGFPQPGKYEILLLANGEEIGRRAFFGASPTCAHWLTRANGVS